MSSASTDRRLGLSGNKAYKTPVTAVVTTNITQSGEQTAGGVALVAGDRVLCTGQTSGAQNGIWDVSTAAWTRSIDANGNYDLSQGTQVFVQKGTGAQQVWALTTADPITLDSTVQTWTVSLSSGFLATLAASSGAALVGTAPALTGAVLRTQASKNLDIISVADFGSTTAAINLAKVAAAALGAMLFFPAATYSVTPATAQVGAGTYNCAFEILSNMHWVGERGAVLKVSDNYSTDVSPKELAICSSSTAVSNVSFSGLTFDLNGANNKMSPLRPVTYNQYNHAAIIFNGPSGYGNDVDIEKCTFKNNAGVCFIVCALVATGTTPNLGVRWRIKDNLFLNGGSDTNDHTSVYGWCESLVGDGNWFWQDSPPHTVGKTGGATGFEVHGSNHRWTNNYVYNYTLGMYVAPNFTNATLNTIVEGNSFYCSDYGILIWRGVALGYLEINGVLIQGNSFYFDSYTYSGQPLYKAGVAYQGQISTAQGAVNNIQIHDNFAINTGTLLSDFVRWDTSTTAAQVGSNLSVTDNQVVGFTNGFHLVTNATSGIGLVEASRNQFISLTPDALANPPCGILINATGSPGIKTLVIDANQFIDERGSPSFAYGISINSGTITDFYLGPQVFKGLTTGNYSEATTVTNWLGPQRAGIFTIPYTTSMTPDYSGGDNVITATNSTAFAINAPIRPRTGGILTITIRNASGGALGTATWNGAFLMSAWTNPADTKSRSITFRYNGSAWVQINQTGLDVPN